MSITATTDIKQAHTWPPGTYETLYIRQIHERDIKPLDGGVRAGIPSILLRPKYSSIRVYCITWGALI